VTQSYTIAKARAGDSGSDGTDAYIMGGWLTQPSIAIAADENGHVDS